jgi:hypothetical protein
MCVIGVVVRLALVAAPVVLTMMPTSAGSGLMRLRHLHPGSTAA